MTRQKSLTDVVTLSFYTAIVLLPLLLVVVNSLRTTSAIYANPLGAPSVEGLANYAFAWSRANFSVYFVNSLLVTTASLVLGIGCATLAAYALARLPFPGRGLVDTLFVAGLLLPAQLGVIPIFQTLRALGLIDSRIGLILVYASSTLPLAILILTVFFRRLPVEIEEAARLDGASRFQIFFHILLPLVRPALATVVVVQCAPIWNDFFFPLVLLRNPSYYTLPIGLSTFVGQERSDYGALFAGLVIVSIPIILIFVVATRHVIAGLTAGVGK